MKTLIIETPRLILRELTDTDKEGMWELDSDPEVHRYLGNTPITSKEEAAKVIRFIRDQYEALGIGRFAVIEKSSGDFVGWSGLKLMKENCNGHIDFYDLGYRLSQRFWGKGYATESAVAWRDHAFKVLNTDCLYGMTHFENKASQHVLEKTGLTFKNKFYQDNILHHWYEMTSQEWQNLKSSSS